MESPFTPLSLLNSSSSSSSTQSSSVPSSPLTPLPSGTSFTHILGQGRVNQLGGVFINGRPLPHNVRVKIIEMASAGVKPCQISRQLRVSHGAVSKILNRFAETGSVCPGQMGGTRSRLPVEAVDSQLSLIVDANPTATPCELRSLLIKTEACNRANAPSVSAINRYLRSRTARRERKAAARLSHSIDSILGLDKEDGRSSSSDEDSFDTRRNRTNFSPQQLDMLEAAFNANSYPDPSTRDELVRTTNISEEKIMTWFSNRRARCRKNLPFLQHLLLPGLAAAAAAAAPFNTELSSSMTPGSLLSSSTNFLFPLLP
ncbi:hypothetical protein PENTCL1PPCAC_7117, partial [Pristionchus entomophagus]